MIGVNYSLFSKRTRVYRYGFNGKEKDDETFGAGNEYDYGFRMYDPRLGRFWSVDPLTKKFAFYTPYQYASNKPIVAIDIDGLEDINYAVPFVDKAGNAYVTIEVAAGTTSRSHDGAILIHHLSGKPDTRSTNSSGLNQVLGIDPSNPSANNPIVVPLFNQGGTVKSGGINANAYELKFKQSDLTNTGVKLEGMGSSSSKNDNNYPTDLQGSKFNLIVPPEPAPAGKSDAEDLPLSGGADLVTKVSNHTAAAADKTHQSNEQVTSVLINYPDVSAYQKQITETTANLQKQYPNAKIIPNPITVDPHDTNGSLSVDVIGSPQQNLKEGE